MNLTVILTAQSVCTSQDIAHVHVCGRVCNCTLPLPQFLLLWLVLCLFCSSLSDDDTATLVQNL
jgi:hypothetical protein